MLKELALACMLISCISFAGEKQLLFFFQAEDGIRVHCVTGVQTCALPISFSAMPAGPASTWRTRAPTWSCCRFTRGPRRRRSEERRVGKESRAREPPYNNKEIFQVALNGLG